MTDYIETIRETIRDSIRRNHDSTSPVIAANVRYDLTQAGFDIVPKAQTQRLADLEDLMIAVTGAIRAGYPEMALATLAAHQEAQ